MDSTKTPTKNMVQASPTDEPSNEFQITNNSLAATQPNSPLTPPAWLKRARMICALAYLLFQTGYFILIIICIVRHQPCEKAPKTPWWMNSVFLRVSTRTMKFGDLIKNLDNYTNNFGIQAIWITPVLPLSNESNPMQWTGVDSNLGGKDGLIKLIKEVKNRRLYIIVDFPLNHVSIQSNYFTSNDDDYFLWNIQGNSSDWKTIDDNKISSWVYNSRKKSSYLRQFLRNNDSIDVNYRNNRVFNEIIASFSNWTTDFNIDGFNLQGISYAYEDYEYRNQSQGNYNCTRHLDEDYFLLASIRSQTDKNKILLLDSIDSLATSDENILTRYYGDENGYLTGVQLASLSNFMLVSENETNITSLFDKYYGSIFFRRKQQLIWSSLSNNSQLNEAFFAACLFHNASISIDINQIGNVSPGVQRERLLKLIQLVRTSDVFRVGNITQKILPKSQFLTIERRRRGSKNYKIIANFNQISGTDMFLSKEEATDAVEFFLTNIDDSDKKDQINAELNMPNSIHLKPYQYLIICWLPPA